MTLECTISKLRKTAQHQFILSKLDLHAHRQTFEYKIGFCSYRWTWLYSGAKGSFDICHLYVKNSNVSSSLF